MQQQPRNFFAQSVGMVIVTFMAVVVTAFLAIPWNLQTIPGEQPTLVAACERHMT